MTTLLEVQNLVKQFPIVGSRKVVQAVNGVDFTIDSGKTTIGRAVVGLIEATAGEIRFNGKLMGRGLNIRSNDIRGRIQLVFQEPAESLNPRGPCRGDDRGTLALSGTIASGPRCPYARSGGAARSRAAGSRPIPSRVERRAAAARRHWACHRHQAATDRAG